MATRIAIEMPQESADKLTQAWHDKDPALLKALQDAGIDLIDIMPHASSDSTISDNQKKSEI